MSAGTKKLLAALGVAVAASTGSMPAWASSLDQGDAPCSVERIVRLSVEGLPIPECTAAGDEVQHY